MSRLLITKIPGQDYYHKQNLSTEALLNQCGDLSIHELGAQMTLVMVKKTLLSGKPKYLNERLKPRLFQDTRKGTLVEPLHTKLITRRSGFLYRGIKLFNQLPETLRDEPKIDKFKKGVKIWVKEKVAVKP